MKQSAGYKPIAHTTEHAAATRPLPFPGCELTAATPKHVAFQPGNTTQCSRAYGSLKQEHESSARKLRKSCCVRCRRHNLCPPPRVILSAASFSPVRAIARKAVSRAAMTSISTGPPPIIGPQTNTRSSSPSSSTSMRSYAPSFVNAMPRLQLLHSNANQGITCPPPARPCTVAVAAPSP